MYALLRKLNPLTRVFRKAIPVPEGPAALVPHRIDDGHADRLFQPLELSQNDRAMRPQASDT